MACFEEGLSINIAGTWTNERGSVLELEEDEEGGLQGTYRTGLGRADVEKSYPLKGVRNDRCAGFVVGWAPDSESVTAWTGLIETDDTGTPLRMHTMWTLVRAGTTEERTGALIDAAPWQAFQVQGSVFTPAA